MDSMLFHRPTAIKTKRTREEDSESEAELCLRESPASLLPTKRVKLSLPPSVLAQRLSSLQINDKTPTTATSTEGVAREAIPDRWLPSCRSPRSSSEDPFNSDESSNSDGLFNVDLDSNVSVSAEASLGALQLQPDESLDDVEADASDLIPINEDPADVQAHTSILRDAGQLSQQMLEQKYPKICSGDILCVHTMAAIRFHLWDDEATCLDCLAHEYDDHQQDMDLMAYELEGGWAGLKASGYEESTSSESGSDQEVEDRDDDTLAREKKEWQEWQENENDADEKTMKLWLSEHAVGFAEGECWEQWLEEPRNGMVPVVRYMLGVGLDENLFVDEDDYQDTREPPPTAKSTCLNCLAETFTHELHEGECKPCAILRQQRKICEETDRKSEQMRREYGFDETTWYGEADEDDINDF